MRNQLRLSICKDCDGHGWNYIVLYRGTFFERAYTPPCDLCKGKGEIVKVVSRD